MVTGSATIRPYNTLGLNRREALAKVGVLGEPAQPSSKLRTVDRVTAVVARAVAHPVEDIVCPAHNVKDAVHRDDVIALAVGAHDVVSLSVPCVWMAHTAPG